MKKRLAILLAVCMVFGLLAGFAPLAATVSADEVSDVPADVPEDRYDPSVEPRTGANATTPFVCSTGTLDGKFSPIFYTSAYDNDVQASTQLGLVTGDKDGFVVAGVEWPCLAYDYTEEVNDDQTETTYKFVLKNGIVFSDGEPVTVDDVLFSVYTLCDPAFDGISNFYTTKVKGMSEYRLQTSTEQLDLVEAIFEAGITLTDDGYTINEVDGVDLADQETFWGYLDAAGEKFAQEIIDYVFDNYGERVEAYFAPYTLEQLQESDTLKAAYGMALWGFGSLDEADSNKFTDLSGNEYDLSADELNAAVYWQNIVDEYGYDLEEGGINVEAAGDKTIQNYLEEEYIANEAQLEGGVSSIEGITVGSEVCEDGIERDTITFVAEGIDPTAIFRFSIAVMPKHYYTDGYEGELNEYGVDIGNPDFMTFLKSKNDKPMGAGPWVFVEWKDQVVTFTANDSFLLGAPKIQTLRYQEIPLGGELDAVKTKTVHYTDPSAKTEIVNDITAAAEGYEHLDYILVDNDGYGYVGIQAQAIPDWNVRNAIAYAMNVQLSVDDYYGELASVNYRTMTKVQWAYPENPEPLYPYDGTGETSKALFLEAGYVYDEENNIMSYPEDSEQAGEQVTYKFTLPSEAKDHPAGSIALDFQQVMASIGVKVDIEVDQNLLRKLSNGYEAGLNLWAAAWGSGGVDPDMFQIWYSDPAVNKADSPKGRGTTWLFQNGSDDQKAVLVELNELILAGRATLDREERCAIYERALELATSLSIEIPTYQRKNMFVYDKTVVNADTLFTGEDVTPFQSPLAYSWNVELLGD